jgi:uncharacterized protein
MLDSSISNEVSSANSTIQVSLFILKPEDAGVVERLPMPFVLPKGATVAQLLILAGLDNISQAVLFTDRAVAVYGQIAQPGTVLHHLDRVEILDRLQFDPMQSRRRRALHKKNPPKSRKRS